MVCGVVGLCGGVVEIVDVCCDVVKVVYVWNGWWCWWFGFGSVVVFCVIMFGCWWFWWCRWFWLVGGIELWCVW